MPGVKYLRWFVASGLMAFFITSCGGDKSPDKIAKKPDQIAKQVKPSVVQISSEDKTKQGTGFFVQGSAKDCAVLTARHALPASGKVNVQTSDQKQWKAANIQRFPNQDLALVTFDTGQENCPYQPLPLADSNKVKQGDPVYISGFAEQPQEAKPGKLVPQLPSGEVTAINKLPDGYGISYKAKTAKGMSGAPVVNTAGEVIAINGRSNTELNKLAEIKYGNKPQQQEQFAKIAKPAGVRAEVSASKWGVPSNTFVSNVPKVSQGAVAKSTAPKTAEEWLAVGNDAYASKRNQEAILAYYKAIKIKPNYALAWYNRGVALNELQRYSEAVTSYDKAIKFQPKDYEAWYNRGVALNELQRYSEAVTSYNKTIQFQPDYYKASYNKGVAQLNLKQYSQAVASYDQAVKFKPDFPEAWYNRGVALLNLQRYPQAVTSYDKAIQFQPDSPEAWNNRGVALKNLQKYPDAIASYDKAIQIQPDFSYAWSNRGNALQQLQRYDDAIASYNQAIKLNPKNQAAIYNRQQLASQLR